MLNLDEFKELLKANNKAAVFFFASWSASCRKIGHIIYHLAGEYTGFLVIKVDIDDHEDIATEYGPHAMPTTFLFKDGTKAGEVIGAEPPSTFEKKIQEVFA